LDEAKSELHLILSFVIFFGYGAVAFWLTIIQCVLIHFVKRAMNSQRILEHKYMGPEIVAVQRRN
jgi:hypothetical protein